MESTIAENGNTVTLHEPDEVYFRRDLAEASNSALKVLLRGNPMKYLHYMTAPDDEDATAAKTFGRAYHCATLEPHVFDSRYTVLPANAPQRPTQAMLNAAKSSPESQARKDWWAIWEAENAGKLALPSKTYDTIRGMADTIRAHALEIPTATGIVTILGAELFDMCEREVTLRWVDRRTGIRCKARLDLHCKELRFGGDLKSCENASPNGFGRACATYDYPMQDAHYSDGMNECGAGADNFLFFASEKAQPWSPCVYEVPFEGKERGLVLRNRALDKLKVCLDSGRWPSYSNHIEPAMLPPWYFYDATD